MYVHVYTDNIYIYIYIYIYISLHDLHHSHRSLNSPGSQDSFFPRDRDVGHDRVIDRIIKTSLNLHTSDRSPDHRVWALASPTTATSIRSNTSDERYSPRQKLGEILNGISTRRGGLFDGIIERSCSKQVDKIPLGRAKGSVWSYFRLRTARTSRIPSAASPNIVRVVGRDLSWGWRRLGFRMPRATRMRSSKTSSSFSSLPEEHVVVTARIVLSSEIDVPRSGGGPTLERLSSLCSRIKDRLIIASRGDSPSIRSIASGVAMGRRAGPELAPAKMAHAEAAIAGSAEGRSLVIGPVLSRQTIGREAVPPIITIAVAPGVKTTVDTGATELFLRANCKSLQGDLIGA